MFTLHKQEEKIGSYWSALLKKTQSSNLKIRWWQSPLIIRHINKMVNGRKVDGFSQGLIDKIKNDYSKVLPLMNGISVGCGDAQKEINLVQQGVVQNFDLFELSKGFISAGQKLIKNNNLDQHLKYIPGNAFEIVKDKYDFVHWNNSLHHMPDTNAAIKWSRDILKPGGLFYMDDYVGASRFQWSDKQLKIASEVRHIFDGTKYMVNPENVKEIVCADVQRPDKNGMIERDPSEASDSENIIEAIRIYFPDAEIIKTGGVIYHLAMSDILHNFHEINDKIILDLLMYIDQLCIELNENQYSVALAMKV